LQPSANTRLTVAAERADTLHRILLKRRPRRVEDIAGLGELFSWPRLVIEVTIGDLCHDGRLEEDARGDLVVRSKAP